MYNISSLFKKNALFVPQITQIQFLMQFINLNTQIDSTFTP